MMDGRGGLPAHRERAVHSRQGGRTRNHHGSDTRSDRSILSNLRNNTVG